MERAMFGVPILIELRMSVRIQHNLAECLQRFVFRRSGKSKVTGIAKKLPAFHHGVDLVLVVHLVIGGQAGQCKVHLGGVSAALAGMRFVNNNGKPAVLVFRTDLRQSEGELLDRGNDDPFACCDSVGQVPGMLSPLYGLCYLHELLDGIADLLIQDTTVGNYDDGINQRMPILHKPNELMRKPCDRIGLAAAGAVLNQISFANAICLNIPEQGFHNVQLMIAGKDLLDSLFVGFRVSFLNNLCIVFDDTAQLLFCKYVFPKVIRHQTIGIRWITGAIVIALIEGQEPTIRTSQFGAELDAGVIHSKMHHAAFESKQLFMGIAVILILLHCVIHVLLGQLILQFKRNDREAVDENAQIQRQSARVDGITQLAGHAEDVLFVHLRRVSVPLGRSQVEHDQVSGIGFDTIPEHIDNATLGQLTLQTVQEVAFLLLRLEHTQLRHLSGLGILQKAEQPGRVHGVFLIVVGVDTFLIVVVIREPTDDEGLQAVFPRIRKSWHVLVLLIVCVFIFI